MQIRPSDVSKAGTTQSRRIYDCRKLTEKVLDLNVQALSSIRVTRGPGTGKTSTQWVIGQ